MRAEIISIGDELTTGQRLDTNSQWLAERLLEIGVPVAFHTTVGDQLADNVLVFRQACERADIVVVTGGLGPTADDLTRQALADVAGVELVQDDASLLHIKALFAKRKREMPPANVVQAMFPQRSKPIFNPNGSAPGIDISIPRTVGKPARVFALPGVPAEMKEMWAATVARAIQKHLGVKKVIAHYRIKCFGVGESDLEAMLPDIIARNRYPLVGITVSQATITLRITAEGETAEAARVAMQPTIDTIHQCVGDLIFGYEDDELQDAVVRLLEQTGQTLAVAELGTGGLLTGWLAETGSRTFRGGAVICDLRDIREFDPDMPTIEDALPDPDMIAALLARRVRRLFNSTYGLAIARLAPLTSPITETLTCALSVASHGYEEPPINRVIPLAGHPEIKRPRALKQVLDFVRLRLLGRG